MASMIFSDDEAKYLRAVLNWQEKPPDDKRAGWMLGLRGPERKPAGEFRVLVIGAKGVGKTSILKKVSESRARARVSLTCPAHTNSWVVQHRCFPRPIEPGVGGQHQWLPS
jgi:hypothetical protein